MRGAIGLAAAMVLTWSAQARAAAPGAPSVAVVAMPASAGSPFAMPKVQLGANAAAAPTSLLAGLPKLKMQQPFGGQRRDYDLPMAHQSKLRYLRAAANVLIADYFVWQQNYISGREYIYVTRGNWSENLKKGFEWDKDPIQTNFFGHPYNGSFYFTGARSAGLSFWEAIPYTLGGSLTWELFGETERPSMNDIFTTTFGGIILGEVMYRVSSQVLDESLSGWPRLGRELVAAAIAPLRGFDRLYTGNAWRNGPAGTQKTFKIAFNTGLERVGSIDFNNEIPATADAPVKDTAKNAVLAAVQIDYGDWLPSNEQGTLGPFDAFRFYASSNVSAANGVQGVQIFGDGLLYGWSSWLTRDQGKEQDNNVFGFGATYDYQGISQLNLSGIGMGPSDTFVFRRKNGHSFRLGTDLQWVPILGTTSADTAESGRNYNLSVGAALGVHMQWDLARYGRLGFRTRQYLGAVVSGEDGIEYTQYSRFWYEVDFVPKLLGIGIAPTILSRYGRYDNGTRFHGNYDSTQIYLTLHN